MTDRTHNVRSLVLRLVLVVAVASMSLSACSSAPTAKGHGPYAEQIAQAAHSATSQFEKQVFANYQSSGWRIARSEFVEAEQRYAACMKQKGVDMTMYNVYGLFNTQVSGAANIALYEKVEGSCEKGNSALIGPLYADMLTNPQNIDFNTVVAECFVRSKVVPAPFTSADLTKLQAEASGGGTTVSGNGSSSAAPTSGGATNSSAEKILDSSRAEACLTNPQYDLTSSNQ